MQGSPGDHQPATVEQLIEMITKDDRLQHMPVDDWRFDDATVVVDVRQRANRPEPYWRAAVRDDLGIGNYADAVRFVAIRLHQVELEGFPPRDFSPHTDGWWRISMTLDRAVGDYVPHDWS
jgi:hypothetical protein